MSDLCSCTSIIKSLGGWSWWCMWHT